MGNTRKPDTSKRYYKNRVQGYITRAHALWERKPREWDLKTFVKKYLADRGVNVDN